MKSLLLLFLLSVSVVAQRPDRWKGLVIDESTAENAIATFGKPKSDKFPSAKYKNAPPERKLWRMLHYESIEEFNDVKLIFNEKGRLVILQLEPKKITAKQLASSYPDVEFRVNTRGPSSMPDNVSAPRPIVAPSHATSAVYYLEAMTEKVMITAVIGNATGSVLGSLVGSNPASLPGDVKALFLTSRSVDQNSQGSDLLK